MSRAATFAAASAAPRATAIALSSSARPYPTSRTHTAAFHRRLVGDLHATLLGARKHAIVVLVAKLLTVLFGFCAAHSLAIFVALFLGHQLAAIDPFLIFGLRLDCLFRPILLSRQERIG